MKTDQQPPDREREIFEQALEMDSPEERLAFIERACAGDAVLRHRLENLLRNEAQGSRFLPGQPAAPATIRIPLPPDDEKPGTMIGRYKLLEKVGEGGFGSVYVAEQRDPVKRRVALKVIKLGMDTKEVVARFEAERQALAMMDHPNIAKVLDAGSTENGRPYFVMELVRGIRITDYCDQNHLSTNERLKLFVLVCNAVQHAHQKGVIHRDLKPSNILITLHDGVPVPKVIDFGIAKATQTELTEKTVYTQLQQFIGTPAYISPEQAEMSGLDIDTRADIYSLGVLLYELLTGQTPFDARELLKAGLDHLRRTIREQEPLRPSTKLNTLQQVELTSTAKRHGTDAARLTSVLRGDLDWIVMKALEKDRTRRYETANGFAADLQRYLSNEPVVARPPSQLYRFQKAYRRNRLAFTAAACVLASLIVALVFIWLAARREGVARVNESIQRNAAEQQKQRAQLERDRAVRAESNAIEQASLATDALQTANERMVKLNLAEGWRRVEEGDYFGALLPFAEAFALEKDKPDRAEAHQMRLASVLQQSPKLVNVWSLGTNVTVEKAQFTKDGTKLIASWKSNREKPFVNSAAVLDAESGRTLFQPVVAAQEIHPGHLSLSGNGERILASSRMWRLSDGNGKARWSMAAGFGYFQTWNVESGAPLSGLIRADCVTEPNVMLNADGTRVTVGWNSDPTSIQFDGTMHTLERGLSSWDLSLKTNFWTYKYDGYPYLELSASITHSPNGSLLVFAGGVLDARSGRLMVANKITIFAEFSPDGSRLFMATRREQGTAPPTLRDGNEPDRVVCEWKHGSIPEIARFSRDGKQFATANSDATARIWNALDGAPASSPLKHDGHIEDLCFSQDGTWLATGVGKLADRPYAQVWDVTTGNAVTPKLPHPSPVLRVSINRDNTRLMVAGEDGTVAVWDLTAFRAPRFTFSVPDLEYRFGSYYGLQKPAQLSLGGQILMIGQSTNSRISSRVSAWNLKSGELMLPPFALRRALRGEQVLTDSNLVVQQFRLGWSTISLTDGSRVDYYASNHFKSNHPIKMGRFSENGRWITARSEGGNEIAMFDAQNGTVAATFRYPFQGDSLERILVSPDGSQAVGFDDNKGLVRWKTKLDAPEFLNSGSWYPDAFSPGGGLLVLEKKGWDTGRVLETQTLRDVATNDGGETVEAIAPNDQWLLVQARSGELRLRSPTNAVSSAPVLGHRGYVMGGAFTPDSQFLITFGSDSALRFREIPSQAPVALPISMPSEATSLLTCSDGRGFVTAHSDDTLRFWEWPRSKRSVSDWLELARLFDQRQAMSSSTPAQTNSGLFFSEWKRLRAKSPEVFTVSADETDAWHRHEAWHHESQKRWSNAVVHLSALLEKHPDSGEFLPRRANAYRNWAETFTATPNSSVTNLLERAIADYERTLAWVDRFPAVASQSRKLFAEERRTLLQKLGRKVD